MLCPYRALNEAGDSPSAAAGRTAHERVFRRARGLLREPEICVDFGEARLCGHPDLVYVGETHVHVVEYKSRPKLRPEYVNQLNAYRWLLWRAYQRPVFGTLALKGTRRVTVLTDAPAMEHEIVSALSPEGALEVARVEWDRLELIEDLVHMLLQRAESAPKVPNMYCRYCQFRATCEWGSKTFKSRTLDR